MADYIIHRIGKGRDVSSSWTPKQAEGACTVGARTGDVRP